MNTLDWHVYEFFIQHRSSQLTNLLVPLTQYTGPSVMAIIAILASLILLMRSRSQPTYQWIALMPAVSVITSNLSSFLIKRIVDRPRPPLEGQLLYHYNPSMPSGHAVGAFALATAMTLVVRRAWCSLLFCIAAVIAVSRLYVGVHWLSDVIAGSFLGSGIALLTWWLIITRNKHATLK